MSTPDLEVMIPDWPAPSRVMAVQTTRSGGVSEACYAHLNLGTACGDDPAAVQENRRRLAGTLGLPAEPCWLEQVHGAGVARPTASEQGLRADAAIAVQAGIVLVVQTADCLPILFTDRAGSQVAVVHAGWRGLVAGVLEATVAGLQGPASALMAWLGPAIGPSAFEVGPEVRAAFVNHDPGAAVAFTAGRSDRWQADLCTLARLRLAALGVVAVHGGAWCTASEPGKYFSHRRDGRTGRMATLVWIGK